MTKGFECGRGDVQEKATCDDPSREPDDWICVSAETEQGLLLRYSAGAVFVPPVFSRTFSPLGMLPQRPMLPVQAHWLLSHHTILDLKRTCQGGYTPVHIISKPAC